MIFISLLFLFQSAQADIMPPNYLKQLIHLGNNEKAKCVNYLPKNKIAKRQIDGTCYSYAASTIFDTLYKKENPDSVKHSSGLATAIEQAKSIADADVLARAKKSQLAHESGNICKIFNARYKSKEVCSYEDIENSIEKTTLADKNYTYAEYIQDLSHLYTFYKFSPFLQPLLSQTKLYSPRLEQAIENSTHLKLEGEDVKYKNQSVSTYAQKEVASRIVCPTDSPKKLLDLREVAEKALQQVDNRDFLIDLIQEKCKDKLQLKDKYLCDDNNFGSRAKMRDSLFSYFSDPEKQQVPLGVYYCYNFFTEGDKFIPKDWKTCANHASVIDGMRWNDKTNSCELHIVNSHGPYGCNGISDNKFFECKNGKMWVNRDRFFNARTANSSMTFSTVLPSKE